MISQTKILLRVAIVIGVLGIANSVNAQTTVVPPPPKSTANYRVIAPESVHPLKKGYATEPAVLHQKLSAPYSYGWFGGTNSGQWSRQFGYSRSYIQWNRK